MEHCAYDHYDENLFLLVFVSFRLKNFNRKYAILKNVGKNFSVWYQYYQIFRMFSVLLI